MTKVQEPYSQLYHQANCEVWDLEILVRRLLTRVGKSFSYLPALQEPYAPLLQGALPMDHQFRRRVRATRQEDGR